MQEGLSSWFPKGHLNPAEASPGKLPSQGDSIFQLMGVEKKLEARAKSEASLLGSGLSSPSVGRGRALEELRLAHSYPFQPPRSLGIYPQMPWDTDMSQP